MITANSIKIFTIVCTIFVTGCATSNVSNFGTEEGESEYVNNSASTVQFKSGITKSFSSLRLVTGVFTSPFLLADGHIKIKGSEINNYYDGRYEAVAQETFYTTSISKLAKKVLPGFAIKEVTGTFNLYSLEFYNDGSISKKYFLQEGEKGAIKLVDDVLLEKHFQEPAANNISKKNSKGINAKALFSLVEKLNKSSSISKN